MKVQFVGVVVVLLWSACATGNRYAYAEMEACPASMSEGEHESGVVRCRAMCSSYARDFAEYDDHCNCRCAPGANGGGYRPSSPKAKTFTEGQTMWSPPSSR